MSEKSAAGLPNLVSLDPSSLFERALEPPRARRAPWILAPLAVLAALAVILLPEKTPPAPPSTTSAPAEKSPATPTTPAKRPVAEIQAAAAAGDIDSQIELALLHLEGVGVPLDKGAAARLLTEAAKAGSALGELYMRGRGVAHDPHKAGYWYERAVEADYLPAHVLLVRMYEGNRGPRPIP